MVSTSVCTKEGLWQNTPFIKNLFLCLNKKCKSSCQTFLPVSTETVVLNIYIINTGYIHPPLDITFFHSGQVLFPFCSCLLSICVPQFSQNKQQPRTFFCSFLQSCATTLAFAQFNYAIITFLIGYFEVDFFISWTFFFCLFLLSCHRRLPHSLEIFFLCTIYCFYSVSWSSLWVLVLFLREDTTLAVALCCAAWSKRRCGSMLCLLRCFAFFQGAPAAWLRVHMFFSLLGCVQDKVLWKPRLNIVIKVFITACSALAFPIGCMYSLPKEMRRFWEWKFSNKMFSIFQIPPSESPKPDTMQL